MERRRSSAAVAAIAGGVLWALTPLRQPLFGAGRTPDEGEAFFRGYNALLVLVAVLLTVASLHLRGRARDRSWPTWSTGWWIVLVGHLLIIGGSLTAVVLGASLRELVTVGQDAGFLGALLAALGGLLLGVGDLRGGALARPAAVLFLAALPVGLLGAVVIAAAGVPEDLVGLPLTVLYGGAWVALGVRWLRPATPQADAPVAPRRPVRGVRRRPADSPAPDG